MGRRNPPILRGVLWDMDGVLVDTGEAHFQTWLKIFDELGLPFDRETFRKTFGMNNAGFLRLMLGQSADPVTITELGDRKESLFREVVRGRVQLLPGAQQWLERLQELGFRQAIASSAPQANIEALVEELKIRPYFQELVSGNDMPGKPEPAVFLEAARRLGLEAGDCIVVEDAVNGVRAARRAGMKCLAVTTTNPKQDLAEADIIVASLEDLELQDFVTSQ